MRGTAPYYYTIYTDQSGATKKPQDYYALYVQDQWRMGNLTLNLGVRAEMTDIKNNVDKSVYKVSLGETIAPRLGFAYDLNGDSSTGRWDASTTSQHYIPTTSRRSRTTTSLLDLERHLRRRRTQGGPTARSCWTQAYS